MANVIIKSDERKEQEAYVRHVFGVDPNDKYRSEIAETISAQACEAYAEIKQLETKRYY